MKKYAMALALFTSTALAWDPAGHMLVGQIAWELSSPKTRAAVTELVATLDNKFNEAQPYNFVTAGCWMDDLRSLPKKQYLWSKWHYVDIAKDDDGKNFELPEPPHVVWAIGENLKVLRDKDAQKDERAKALGQIIHWIGDVHQPLHATTWDDHGGNGYLIMGVPFTDLWPGTKANLHSFWDKAFRFDLDVRLVVEQWQCPKTDARPKAPGEGVIADEAKKLMARFPKNSLPELATKSDAEAWAKESHILGCTKAYPPGEHPRDTAVHKLSPTFIQECNTIAGRRVVLAGHRLAALLGELFP